MKVIQIIPAFSGYGADRLVVDLHHTFLEKGVKSYILALTGGIPKEVPSASSLGISGFYHFSAIGKLMGILKYALKEKSDEGTILHTHLTPCQLWTPIAMKRAGWKYPVFTTEHSTSNRRQKFRLGKIIDRQIYKPFRRIVCISEGVRRSMAFRNPWLKKKLTCIPNGINLNKFKSSNRPDHGCRRPIVISVGRLQPMKNYETAIRACSLLKQLDFQYHILGDGPDNGKLKKLAEKLGLGDKVKFLGFQKDVTGYLHHSNVFLMPSRWEGFGMAAVEAMAAGLPVVISDVPGLREILERDGKGGLFVDPESPANIAAALKRLIRNPEICEKMGRRNRTSSAKYSIQRTADSYLELYKNEKGMNAGRIS